jgi:hypothetical protein
MPEEAYTKRGRASNPVEPFQLTAYEPPERKHLDPWVTRGLAALKVRVWSLASRLARTWDGNPNHSSGTHSAERWEKERALVADLKRLEQTRHFIDCARHSPRLRASYLAVIGQVHRLLEAGDWWKPQQLVDRKTGEVNARVYLPEDTWSAAGALNWAVDFLVRLLAAVPRVTERVTPRYRTGEAARASGRSTAAVSEEESRRYWAAKALKWGGAQPELPATT